ncbi:TonB-dependent siderophore receptor [Massilia violaceinigra]|uniref:TonB-dependent siderophore receptor n=2 Tax=Massilia violaceinigra TaxID=2045208 RepID=A0A2D2DNE7_9BURK|nr:TonB-dependent siderophore receptor [Massilia violaceinigra]
MRVVPVCAFRAIPMACMTMIATVALPAMAQAPVETMKEITVKAAAETADSLPAAAPGGKVAKGARLGVLGNVSVMDTPFNITAYTSQTIADQQAQTIGAVLKNDPSVRTTTNEGHLVENFNIRGFGVSSGSMAINGAYGLAPEQNTPTDMFERVEVLKGPGAMMMGLPPAGDVGGAVNLVPKRAGATPLTRVTTSVATKSNVGVHADVARRFGADQSLGVRVNGVLSGGKTWLDHQTKRREIGHVAVDYQGKGWNVEMDAYSLTNKVRKGAPMQPVLTGWTRVPKAPHGSTNFFYGEDVYGNTETQGLIVRGQVELGAGWSAFASAGTAKHSYDGFIFGTRPVLPVSGGDSGKATGTAYNSWGEYETSTFETGVRGQFATGAIAHKVTVAANVMNYEGGSRGNGTLAINSNIYNPTPIIMPAGKDASTYSQFNDDVMTAVSVADSMWFADGKLQVTIGARAQKVHQKLSNYEETAVTPLAGVVVKPWGENVSLYANYVEGLSAGTTVKAPYANEGETFKPYKSKQAEVGVKWAMNTLTQTLSLFQISKPALIESNNRMTTDGEQRNRGVEWNVFGKAGKDITLLGGMAYTKAEQTKTAKGLNQGKAQFGIPRLTANIGVDYAIAAVPGLELSSRVNYTGSQWLSQDNALKLDSWTTLDLGARYATRFGAMPVVLRAYVTNVADKEYFESAWGAGRVNVGAPRAVRLSAAFDF